MKLIVKEVNGYKHDLIGEDNKIYTLNLHFFDLDQPVGIGDAIYLDDRLLDKTYVEYSTEYYFGALDKPYGRKIDNEQSPDLICVDTVLGRVFLKRFFG